MISHGVLLKQPSEYKIYCLKLSHESEVLKYNEVAISGLNLIW